MIIPTLNAADTLVELLGRLRAQTLAPDEVIVVDSDSDDGTAELARLAPGVRVITVAREAFDHGGTRDAALRQSTGDYVCFLTQDALPVDETYLEKLLAPFEDARIACVCARQTARPGATIAEQLTRAFNYPAESFVRDQSDLPRLGIKTFFLSDACSAYRRAAYLAVGGFEKHVLTNEDMLIAARMIAGGYRIAYQAEALVLHSHCLTLRGELRRNFDIGVFLRMYESELLGAKAESEGLRYVLAISGQMLRGGHGLAWARFIVACAAKMLGSRLGYRYGRLSHRRILRLTGNPAYWRVRWSNGDAA